MTLRFEQIFAEGIAQCSYLVGDDASGTAAVIDPRPDAGVYVRRARALGLAITHVFETHIHADFLSGARELAAALGGRPKLCLSAEGGADYGFDTHPVRDGDAFRFGAVRLVARHTPGHTPEHLAFLLHEGDTEEPWGVLSGDALFAASVGRPDLLGEAETDRLTADLFRTTHDIFLALPDGVIVYPCHGAGSACGPDIGDRTSTTIGYERRHNPYATIEDLGEFKAALTADAPPVPRHYRRLKRVNARGPEVQHGLPRLPGLDVDAFDAALKDGAQLLDMRDMLAFGGGHIAGALNIAMTPEASVWAGWLLDPAREVALVLPAGAQPDQAVRLLWRTGFSRFAGYLAGGMDAWRMDGRALDHLRQVSVHELRAAGAAALDVRSDAEWQGGHIPGATHRFLGRLAETLDDLDRDRPWATYCASGFRASIAASLLRREGFRHVSNVPGSWAAWTAAGYPTEG
jgi:hydroxyacylglutathione hydrolase